MIVDSNVVHLYFCLFTVNTDGDYNVLPSLKAISTQDNVHIKKHQLLHSSRLKEQKEHVDLHSVKSRPDTAMIKIDGGLLCFISVAAVENF